MEKPYLSIQEVAKRFRVNNTTVYRLVKQGRLPAFKVGNQWRFSEQVLDSWAVDQVTVKWLLADEVPKLSKNRHRHLESQKDT